jgi:tRNA1Val (adenine37-N6)-methyltransferase
MTETTEEVTHDTLLRGRVKLIQPARGFRSSLDPVLLAAFVAPPYGHFLDVGCGTGAVSFLLLARDPAATGVAVEVQPRLAALAEEGAAANGFSRRLAVRLDDASRMISSHERFDLIATNPPFQPLGRGNLPPDEERSIAHHEVRLTLEQWLSLAAALLAPEGRLAAIFPAERLSELEAGVASRALALRRVRLVCSQAGEPPRRALIEASRAAGEVHREPPLVTHEDGRFTPEVERMVSEGF